MSRNQRARCASVAAIVSYVIVAGVACTTTPPKTKATKNEICIDGNCFPLERVVQHAYERSSVEEMLLPWGFRSDIDVRSHAPEEPERQLYVASLSDAEQSKIAFVLDRDEPANSFALMGPASDKCFFRMVARLVAGGPRAVGTDCRGRSVSLEFCFELIVEGVGWRPYSLEVDPCDWHVAADPIASQGLYRELGIASAEKVTIVDPRQAREGYWMIAKGGALLTVEGGFTGEIWGLVRDWDITAATQDTVVEWCRLDAPKGGRHSGSMRTDPATITRTGTHIKVKAGHLAPELTPHPIINEIDFTPHPVIKYGYWEWLNEK